MTRHSYDMTRHSHGTTHLHDTHPYMARHTPCRVMQACMSCHAELCRAVYRAMYCSASRNSFIGVVLCMSCHAYRVMDDTTYMARHGYDNNIDKVINSSHDILDTTWLRQQHWQNGQLITRHTWHDIVTTTSLTK